MSSKVCQFVVLPTLLLMLLSAAAFSDDVQWFNSQMQDEWWDAVGETTTIDFTGFEHGEPLRDQYAHLGIRFNNVGPLSFWESGAFVNDGWGFRGWNGAWILFDEPMNWIAADFPGGLGYELYSGDELIYTSFAFGGSGTGKFGGLVSSKAFDKVFLWKHPSGPFNEFIVYVDDLHFGALSVPAPGALSVFALAMFLNRRRRC